MSDSPKSIQQKRSFIVEPTQTSSDHQSNENHGDKVGVFSFFCMNKNQNFIINKTWAFIKILYFKIRTLLDLSKFEFREPPHFWPYADSFSALVRERQNWCICTRKARRMLTQIRMQCQGKMQIHVIESIDQNLHLRVKKFICINCRGENSRGEGRERTTDDRRNDK